MGYIYFCQNKINGFGYVGQTTRTMEARRKEHFKPSNDNSLFHNALRKYGQENFTWVILEECENELLNEREIYWIKEKNTFYKEGNGYNMTKGGDWLPEQPKKKVRIFKILNDDYSNPILKKEKDCESIAEASRYLREKEQKSASFVETNISNICKGVTFSLYGYTFCFLDENNKEIPTNYVYQNSAMTNCTTYNQKICKAIKLVNSDNIVVGYYPSISQAQRETGIYSGALSKSAETNQFIKQGKGAGLKAIYLTEEEVKVNNVLLQVNKKITSEMIEKINQVYETTHNQNETARILGISRYSVMRYLRRK